MLAATHTIFPLSLEKVLILTNLTWARNPYQDPTGKRPNANLSRIGVHKTMKVQTERYLSEREVLEVNFIIRSRALRYVAAAEPEWLFPENHVSKSQWAALGDGYLLMPDPRRLWMGGTIFAVDEDGGVFAADEYGRRPWEKDFESRGAPFDESVTLNRFKGEFARLVGLERRGRIAEGPEEEDPRDDDDYHEYHLSLEVEGGNA